jgi:TolA-binding protein
MKTEGTERNRRAVAAAGLMLIAIVGTAVAQDRPAEADKAQQQVDPATKKLLAAHGLFQRGLFKLAVPEYESFLHENPSHAEATTARYALAVCHYRLNEFDPAIQLLDQVVKDASFRQRDEALAVLGHSHLAKKSYDPALSAFDEILAKHDGGKQAEGASLNRAQVLYLAGRRQEALDASRQFLDKFPQSTERPTGLYFLALSQYALNKPAEAGQTLVKLLQSHADSRHALDATLLLGQCLEAAGDVEQAAQQYRRFIDLAPAARKADGQFSLGVALYKSGKHDEAIRELSRLAGEGAKENPYAAPARLQLGLVQLATGKTADARRTLQQVVTRDPARRDPAAYALAQCDIADRRWDSARAALDELASRQPPPANLSQVLLDRAVCAAELNKHEQAVSEFEQFLARHADSPQAAEAAYRQAYSLHKLGKFEASRAAAQRVATSSKDNAFAQPAAELDAENLFLLTKYDDAGRAFEKLATSTKDDDARLRFELRRAQCRYFARDYAGATALLQPLAANNKVGLSESLRPAIFLLGDALLQQGKHAEAVEPLERYVHLAAAAKGKPGAGADALAEAQFKLGLARLRAGNADAAEHAFADLTTAGTIDSPWVQRALFERGQLLYKAKKPQPAAEALTRVASSKAPEELAAPAQYLLGWIDFDAKHYEQAAVKWKDLLDRHGMHALAGDAAFQRGVALKEAGKHDDALSAFNEYLSKLKDGPQAAKARQLAAAELAALNRNDEAEAMLATLAADTRLATDTVLYDLAWTQRSRKDPKSAAETYRKLIARFGDGKLAPAARAELAELLYGDNNFSEAVRLLEAVLADDKTPDKVDPRTLLAARYRLGWCYEKLGEKDKAAAALAAFAEKHPESELAASALLQAGLSYAADGRMDASERALRQMLDKFPQHKQASVALLKLGEVQAESKDFDASRTSFQQFLDRYASDPLAYRAQFGIGWAHENQKHYDEARTAYQKVIAATNTETAARAQFQIGETWLAQGKFDQAVAALLAVEDVYAYPQWSARALFEAGRAFEQMKQPDQARQQYKLVTEKYKDAPEAAAAGERLRELKAS